MAGKIMSFPSDMSNPNAEYGYGNVHFKLKTRNGGPKYEIFLPIPQGFTMSDSASYSDTDLGKAGILLDKYKEQVSAGSTLDELKSISVKDVTDTITAMVVDKFGGGKKAAAQIATGTVMAPNTNTIFENVGTRKFDFTFKLIPKTQKDSDTIRTIINTFRLNLYPLSSNGGLTLRFPDVWEIKFYNGYEENEYISKIWEDCYLESFSTNYNSTSNMFHKNGQPIETDISLSFRETKALHKAEMKELLSGETPGWSE